jgi:hypothetical protein
MDEKTNGPFEDTATFSQILKTALRRGKNWDALSNDAKEALEQAATSIARILNGDPLEIKHWQRAANYLQLRASVMDRKLENEVKSAVTERLRPPPPRPTMVPRQSEELGDA